MAVKNCFIRGSVVRYVQLPAEHVDTQLLEDATRRGESLIPYYTYLTWPQRRKTRSNDRLLSPAVLLQDIS